MITALLLTMPAMAYRHTGSIWDVEDNFPRHWVMDDQVEDSLAGLEEQETLLEASWDAWEEAPCADVGDEVLNEGATHVTPSECPNSQDGLTSIFWDDPCDQMASGVLGVTYTQSETRTVLLGGKSYKLIFDTDIIFNDSVGWATPDEISNGTCSGDYDLRGVATHEIGHSYGMGHSCEQGESCPDPLKADATMFWSGGACSDAQSVINQDDIDGITALYGVGADIKVKADRLGKVPFDVSFRVQPATDEATVISADWDFGDGGTSTELEPTHTYEAENQYTVSADFVLNTAECGDVSYRASELGFILACDAPRFADGATGFFQLQHEEGLLYSVINHTDVSTYGCVDTIEWAVYRGKSEADINEANLVSAFGAWSPLISFPEEGSYLIVMNVGGPGGLVASSLTIDAVDSGGGCNTAPGVAALGLFGLLAIRRRRA